MSKFLDSTGLETLWDLIKSAFASSLSINNRTISLKNGKDEILGSTTLPFYGVYFVKGTQTSATGTWTGNLPEVNSLYDGLTIAYFLPYAGSGNATLTLTLGTGTPTTTQPEPVYYNNETRASTNYGKGSTVVLTWVSNATTGYEAVGSATGRWTRCDYNSNTVPSAYCTTAASTATKAAACTNYYLLNNSYIHVLISQTNTAKSALTLNINSKGAKPIYINGTASSASNYTLPAGTYIVFYDGTNYYFNTNGNLPGHIDGSSITGDISADNLNVDLYNEAFRAVRILAWPSAVSTGGWKRLCLIGGYNAYAVGKILINGGYSYGRPTNAQCDFYYNYNKAGIKQTSGIVNDTILALRLVYNGSSKWWLDVKMDANSSGAMSNQYITLIGAFSVTNITEDNTFLTEDPATTVALCELRTMVDTPTITVDLTSGTASAFTGADMTTGVTGILSVANGGTGKNTLDSGKALIGNGTSAVTLRDIYTKTSTGNLEWSSATNEHLITKGTLAYWNGAYGTGGTSNIKKLGTIDTGVWQGTTIDVAYGGTGQITAKDASNAFINALDTETTALQDGDYFIAQTSGGGTTTTTYKRKTLSTLATYIGDSILDDYGFLVDKTTAIIPANADLDDYKTPGVYLCYANTIASTVANAPCETAFSLVVLPISSYAAITESCHIQIVRKYLSKYTTYTYQNVVCTWQRSEADGVWKPWTFTSGVSSVIMPGLSNNTSTRYSDINFDPSTNGMGSMFHFIGLQDATGGPETNSTVLQMNWDTSGGYDTQLAIGNTGAHMSFRGANGKNSDGTQKWLDWRRVATVDYFTCDTASGTVAKNVTVNKTLRYYEGTEFIVKFTNGNTVANPTFSVNSLAARPIYLNGSPVPTDYIKSGDVVRFVYHDTSFDIIDRGLDAIKAYDNHIRYYIHRTDGSDTNDGLTTNTPFKTIEKFLEVTANAGYTDCRCTILKDGSYVLNKQALNNVTLHIKVDDSVNGNVILQGNYNVPEDWIMYNAHVKLTGTANAPIVYQPYSTQGIYFENSAVTLDYVKFKCRMQGFGCYIKADNIEADTLHFSGCTGYLATVAITNDSHTKHGILLDRGCNMRVSGTFTIGALTDGVASSDSNKNKNYFLNIQDSDIVLQSSYPTTLYNFNNNSTIDITNDSNRTTYSYAYGMRLSNAEITGTRIRLASYVSRGVNKTMLADEESDINVTWGGGSGDSANGRAGFNSLYGLESIVLNTDATDLVSASAIKTWTIPKATIVSAIASDHPNVGTSAYPYKILAVVPVSTNDNRVIIKNSTVDSTTGDITVVGRNVTSSNLQNLGIFATVSILYTMSPFSITYHS